jgi:hypothetical protein
MILNKDVRPERKIYFIAALVIDVLKESKEGVIDHLYVFEKLQESEGITAEVFLLALDWLFLLGAIKTERGVLIKCF